MTEICAPPDAQQAPVTYQHDVFTKTAERLRYTNMDFKKKHKLKMASNPLLPEPDWDGCPIHTYAIGRMTRYIQNGEPDPANPLKLIVSFLESENLPVQPTVDWLKQNKIQSDHDFIALIFYPMLQKLCVTLSLDAFVDEDGITLATRK